MAGLFSILNTSSSGMTTQQAAINVTSHNISNASTEGYSRQSAVIKTTRPETTTGTGIAGQIGTGSQVTEIQRVRNAFLDYQIRNETSTQSQYKERDTTLGEVETIINGTSDTGISTLMSEFYSSWQTLSTNADGSVARTSVKEKSAALADELNNTYSKLQDLKTNTQSQIKDTVFQVNNTLDQIDKLNQQIMEVKISGQEPNDLEDSRDLLLDKLSADFNITVDKKNLDGIDLKSTDNPSFNLVSAVDSTNDKRLAYVGNKLVWTNKDGTNPTGVSPTSGSLAGDVSVQNDIDDYTNQLNNLAEALAVSVNTIHEGGTLTGTGAGTVDATPFFVNKNTSAESGITAQNISVNSVIMNDVSKINAKGDNSDGSSDGTRALAIAQSQNVLLDCTTSPGTPSSTGSTIENYFKDTVDRLAVQVQQAGRIVTNQASLLSSLTTSKESESGVSLDEEMVNLIKYQHGYQANAKVISTVNDLLDVVIKMV